MVLLAVMPAAAQSLTFGVKLGVPVTDTFILNNGASSINNYTFDTLRYTVGPTVELGLPLGLTLETDALYKRLRYDSYPFGFDTFRAETTADSWEFPFLLKRRLPRVPLHPHGSLGVSLRHVSGSTYYTNGEFQSTQEIQELVNTWSTGFAVGGGTEITTGMIHLTPEIRYTRWATEYFRSPNAVLASNRDAVDFLIGVTFHKKP
jgi:opacity protein-like surface antigen